MVPRSKLTERTLKVTSDGLIFFLAFEVCWSREPDGTWCSDDLRNIRKGITCIWSVIWQWMLFSNDVLIKNCIVDNKHGVSDVRWGYVGTDDEVQQLWKVPVISRTLAFEERVTVNPQVSLMYLTLEAGIPGDVMWSLIDGKPIVSVPHHDGLLVDRVDDGLAEEIDRVAADFAMRWK